MHIMLNEQLFAFFVLFCWLQVFKKDKSITRIKILQLELQFP